MASTLVTSNESLCDKCVALCCRYIALPLDNPTDARDYDNIRWYLMHENIVVYVEDGQWYIGIMNKCKNLMPDNRCGVYDVRPRVCREYHTTNCEYHGTEYGFEHLFTSAEQLTTYAKTVLKKKKKTKTRRMRLASGAAKIELPVLAGAGD